MTKLERLILKAITLGIECQDALNPYSLDRRIKKVNNKIITFIEENEGELNADQICSIIMFGATNVTRTDPCGHKHISGKQFLDNLYNYLRKDENLSPTDMVQLINLTSTCFATINAMPLKFKDEDDKISDVDDKYTQAIGEFLNNVTTCDKGKIPIVQLHDAFNLYNNECASFNTFVGVLTLFDINIKNGYITNRKLNHEGRILVNFILPASKKGN